MKQLSCNVCGHTHLKLLLKARTWTFLLFLRGFQVFHPRLDLFGKWSCKIAFVLIIMPTLGFCEDIASFKAPYNALKGKSVAGMPGIVEGSPMEASLAGGSSLDGAIQERLHTKDPAIEFMNETTKDRPYFIVHEEDPFVKGAQNATKDPESFLKAGVFVSQEIEEAKEVICEEGKGLSRTSCVEEPIVEILPPTLVEHPMHVHIFFAQNWSYDVFYNIFTGARLNREASRSPGVTSGHFPADKIKHIKQIRVARVVNTLNGQPSGPARSLNIDPRTGNIRIATPYGHCYPGRLGRPPVKWDAHIDLVIVYEKPARKIGIGKGCDYLKEKVAKGQCKLVDTTSLPMPLESKPEGVEEGWYRRRLTFECGSATASACRPLRDQGCYQVKSHCKTKQGDTCVLWEQTYMCPLSFRKIERKIEIDIPLHEGSIASYASNTEMADAIAKLQILKEVQDNIRQGSADALPSIFNGGSGKCTIAFGKFKSCCAKAGGWGVSMNIAGCSGEEKDLAQKRGRDLCVEVGTYCAKKLKPIGCLKKKKSYCCFGSKLSRILHEQGRAQLGIGWGDPEHPNCRGLSVEELAHINFDKLNLSELFAEIASKVKPVNPGAITQRIEGRVHGMTTPFKQGEVSV